MAIVICIFHTVYSYAKKQESKVNELQAEIKNLREKNEELKQKITASECDLARLRFIGINSVCNAATLVTYTDHVMKAKNI